MAEDIDKLQQILKKAEEYAARKAEKGEKPKLSSGAFWVSPQGKVRVVKSGNYHINDVIQNPDVFGWTKEEIDNLYDQHGEKIGQEGDARDNLMTSLLKDGWVRIRIRKNFYSIQVWDFNPNTFTKLESFVSEAITDGINGQYASAYDEAKINALKSGRMKSLSFDEILKGYLYESEEKSIDFNFFKR